jgi:23S rRNA (uracil1939-C5)-methyltransferase
MGDLRKRIGSPNDFMEQDIILTTFTYGGDSMGRLADGRAVFIPFALPGERARVRLTDEKRNFVRGELVEILETSPQRIVPRCVHFGVCGGCHYQHFPYEDQLLAKAEILRDQLIRIGRIENPPVQKMVACPDPWNYRNHVQFHLTKTGRLGYVGAGPTAARGIIPITECHLPTASINSLWPQLEFESELNVDRVALRAGENDDLMLVLESDSPDPPELETEAGISIAHIYEDHAVVVAGNDHIMIRVLDREFRVSAGSFFQVNTIMAGKMVNHIITNLPITSSTVFLDLYCGVGLFSAFLAPKCAGVMGIESSPSACEDFTFNLDEFDNVELYEGSAEDIIPYLEAKPEIALVDPPRTGLEKRVVDGILKLAPLVIAYVSCDPSTLARDAKRLIEGGYQLSQVTPFDLFPQTYHIESISIFER